MKVEAIAPEQEVESMEEAAVVREEKGPVSSLTMQYRPYNLLGPTLLGAIADGIARCLRSPQPTSPTRSKLS